MTTGKMRLFTTLSVFLLVLVTSALAQSSQKMTSRALGEIIGNSVKVNGALVQRGSTIFDGSEIQTADDSVFINLLAGGGVLSVAPGSQVKVTREQSRIIAEVLKGSVTIRSPLRSTVIAPDRVVDSEADNILRVSVSDSGTNVESLFKSVVVRTADGVAQTVAAGATNALASTVLSPESRTRPNSPQLSQITNRGRNCSITSRCTKNPRPGVALRVNGRVNCANGGGVGGANVTVRLITFGGNVVATMTVVSAGNGNYVADFATLPVDKGAAIVSTDDCGACSDESAGGALNRCVFS